MEHLLAHIQQHQHADHHCGYFQHHLILQTALRSGQLIQKSESERHHQHIQDDDRCFLFSRISFSHLVPLIRLLLSLLGEKHGTRYIDHEEHRDEQEDQNDSKEKIIHERKAICVPLLHLLHPVSDQPGNDGQHH